MSKSTEITSESFHKFLKWLDSDMEKAGNKYEQIRMGLIKIFYYRGFIDSEELTDEVFNRIIKRISSLKNENIESSESYIYKVAKNLMFEKIKTRNLRENIELIEQKAIAEWNSQKDNAPEKECLRKCLNKLNESDKELLLDYYSESKGRKIELRKKLADELGITLIALRMRAFHLKEKLAKCVKKCLE